MRLGTALAGLATLFALALLLSDSWWGVALFGILAAAWAFVICFRELSGSEEGRGKSSKDLAIHAAGSVLGMAVITAIIVFVLVLQG
jgi:hypothetical protein